MWEKRESVNDTEVHYKIAGEGPPILILHGWGGSSHSWRKVQELLSEEGFQVIALDFPGFGNSPPPQISWSVWDYAEFVKNFMDKLGIEKFLLLGHSFGGRIAIKFTGSHPERVSKLILVDAAGIDREQTFTMRQKLAAKLRWSRKLVMRVPFLNRLYPFFRQIAYRFAGVQDYFLLKDPIMRETFRKVIAEDLTPIALHIKTPTLIIWGEHDKLIPVKVAHSLKKRIQNSKLEVLSKTGHSPHVEQPEKLSEIIVQFLRSA